MPVLDQVQRPPRESIGVIHERETRAKPKPPDRSILDLFPKDVVDAGKRAFDVMGKLGFVDFQTGLDRLMNTWSDDSPDVGARLRKNYEAHRKNFQKHQDEARARRESEAEPAAEPAAEAEPPDRAGERDEISTGMTERIRKLSYSTLGEFEGTILKTSDTPWRQQVLDMISAERQRRADDIRD